MNMDLVNEVTHAYLETAVGSDAARLAFLKGIWEIQSAVESVGRTYTGPDADAARAALVAGQPIFAIDAPEVPAAEYAEAVSRIARYVSDTAGLPADQAEALRAADFSAAIDPEHLAAAVRCPEAFVAEAARDMGAQPGGPLTSATVAFVLLSALVPFLTGPAHTVVEALGDSRIASGTGSCPVCGSAASMGLMGESTTLKGAERTLWCGICHAEWGYERLRCVRCGSRNPDMLRYTYIEGDAAHRVHLCDECHGYARFAFVDELGKPVSMVVEDAVMAPLDAVAAHQGYTATGDGGTKSC